MTPGVRRDAAGQVLGTNIILRDVADELRLQAGLREAVARSRARFDQAARPQALLDLHDRLATAALRHERSADRGVAVLFVDLDDFEAVNDSHGHHVGDAALVEVATRLSESVRAADTAARLGGDEFAVICEDSDPEIAALVASRIHRGLAPPVDVPGASQVMVRASIGIATTPPYAVGDLLRFADRARYRAKLTRALTPRRYDGPGRRRGGTTGPADAAEVRRARPTPAARHGTGPRPWEVRGPAGRHGGDVSTAPTAGGMSCRRRPGRCGGRLRPSQQRRRPDTVMENIGPPRRGLEGTRRIFRLSVTIQVLGAPD